MTSIKKYWQSAVALLLPLMLIFILLEVSVPQAPPLFGKKSTGQQVKQKELLNFVAIGDSLTEGVGDTTEAGGYVPLLKQGLTEATGVDAIHSDNFGKAGDRTDQIIKRIEKSVELQSALKKADFITVTTGGNDLMKVVKSEFLNDINYETFDKPRETFQQNIVKLMATIRTYNKAAPIYQMGIYNPFYISFKGMTEMQEIVTLWNNEAEQALAAEAKTYFIPINDALYKGIDGQSGIGEETLANSQAESAPGVNNLISDIDNFHPNNLGYQIMANAFQEKLIATKNEWLNNPSRR